MDKYLAARSKQHIRAFTMEIVRKPIQRYPKGKAFGTGSFWQRKPFDYSDYARDLPQTHFDVSVPRISRSLIVADVALKTMSALTAEIHCKKSTLTGRCVQVSK